MSLSLPTYLLALFATYVTVEPSLGGQADLLVKLKEKPPCCSAARLSLPLPPARRSPRTGQDHSYVQPFLDQLINCLQHHEVYPSLQPGNNSSYGHVDSNPHTQQKESSRIGRSIQLSRGIQRASKKDQRERPPVPSPSTQAPAAPRLVHPSLKISRVRLTTQPQ